jgi:hypothetical protein
VEWCGYKYLIYFLIYDIIGNGMVQELYIDQKLYINDQIFENTFWEDFMFAFSYVMKFAFLPIYLIIVFYRNFMALWSDNYLEKQIRKQIDICKKRNSQNKKRNNIDVTDEMVCKYLRSLGIFCVDKRDIRSVMKMMKNRKKIEGVSGSFLQIFTYLFTRRDKYQKYIVLKIA